MCSSPTFSIPEICSRDFADLPGWQPSPRVTADDLHRRAAPVSVAILGVRVGHRKEDC